MKFMTDRKRAVGLGASGQGTQHHWQMMVSSILMLIAVPVFVFTFGAALGGGHKEVIAFLERPVVAIMMGLSLFVIVNHVKHEVHEAIEDYVHDPIIGKLSLIGISALSWVLIVSGLVALVKIAL